MEYFFDETGNRLSFRRASNFRFYKGPRKKTRQKSHKTTSDRQNIRTFYGNLVAESNGSLKFTSAEHC